MTLLVKDTLYDTTVVERIVEVVVPATSYQVTLAGGLPEQIEQQKSSIKPRGPSSGFSASSGGGTGGDLGSAYSYNGIQWNSWDTDAPKPPGWVII